MPVSGKGIRVRKVWGINPRTRVKLSKKVYSRQRLKRESRRIVSNEEKGA